MKLILNASLPVLLVLAAAPARAVSTYTDTATPSFTPTAITTPPTITMVACSNPVPPSCTPQTVFAPGTNVYAVAGYAPPFAVVCRWTDGQGAVRRTTTPACVGVGTPIVDRVTLSPSEPDGAWIIHLENVSGTALATAQFTVHEAPPTATQLDPTDPNVLGPRGGDVLNIHYTLAQATHVRIDVFSRRGALIRTLANSDLAAGRYVTEWTGLDDRLRKAPSGVYELRLTATNGHDQRKLIVQW